MKKEISLLLMLILGGCSTGNKLTAEKDISISESKDYHVYEEMIYDEFNIPAFKNEVKTKSEIDKKQYTVVLYENGRVTESRLVGIVPGKDDASFKKPFNVIYKWTGKGFKTGWELLDNFRSEASGGNQIALFSKEIAMVITGTAGGIGGFIIGVAAGTKTAYDESYKLFSNKEIVLNTILYHYDSAGRLELMQIFAPSPEKIVIVETKFFYRKNKNPYKVVTRNLQTKKEIVNNYK